MASIPYVDAAFIVHGNGPRPIQLTRVCTFRAPDGDHIAIWAEFHHLAVVLGQQVDHVLGVNGDSGEVKEVPGLLEGGPHSIEAVGLLRGQVGVIRGVGGVRALEVFREVAPAVLVAILVEVVWRSIAVGVARAFVRIGDPVLVAVQVQGIVGAIPIAVGGTFGCIRNPVAVTVRVKVVRQGISIGIARAFHGVVDAIPIGIRDGVVFEGAHVEPGSLRACFPVEVVFPERRRSCRR